MQSVDIGFRLKEFTGELKMLGGKVSRLGKSIGINELWDNADMVRYWKVSTRTLATWRAEGLIGYVQVGNKIWYPREAREEFTKRFEVKPIKVGGRNDG